MEVWYNVFGTLCSTKAFVVDKVIMVGGRSVVSKFVGFRPSNFLTIYARLNFNNDPFGNAIDNS